VADLWVVNASPLIALEKIGCLYLLASLAREVVIPQAVLTEVGTGPKPLLPEQLGTHRRVSVPVIHAVVAAWDLGPGESEVVSWAASQPNSHAVLDDRAARNCAAALGVPTMGTIGVLLAAKRAGLIPAVASHIEGLRRAGLYLSDKLVQAALKVAGESG
jgi:predicted nucleic acid-binding protein